MTERRRHPRIAVDSGVRLTADGDTVDGRLHDLSVDATLVHAPRTWPVGTPVQMEVTLPGDATPLQLTGTIIRLASETGATAMAVLFTDLPPSAATRIDLFLDRESRS